MTYSEVCVRQSTDTQTNSASHTPTQTQNTRTARTVYIKVLIPVSPEELKCISMACVLWHVNPARRGGKSTIRDPVSTRRTIHLSFSSDPTGGAFLRLPGEMSAAIRNEKRKRWSLMDKWDLKLAVPSTFCKRCRFTKLHFVTRPL